MEKTQKTLKSIYVGILVLAVLMVVLWETGTLESGRWFDCKQSEFILLTIMELVTLAATFLALRLFKFLRVSTELALIKSEALMKWGVLRLVLLELPMLINTFFYYMFMTPTFGYLAIIQLLCLPFVYPSMSRCIEETIDEDKA